MIRPGEPATRDLEIIRRRLLARAITALADRGQDLAARSGFPYEILWLLKPGMGDIAGRLVRHGLDFRAAFKVEDKTFRVEVHPWDG